MMKISYKCSIVKYNPDPENGWKDRISFIFEFLADNKIVRELAVEMFSPFLIVPLSPIQELVTKEGLKGDYWALWVVDTPKIFIVEDYEFTMVSLNGCTLRGGVTKSNLNKCELSSLYELADKDSSINIIFTNHNEKTSNRQFYYCPLLSSSWLFTTKCT